MSLSRESKSYEYLTDTRQTQSAGGENFGDGRAEPGKSCGFSRLAGLAG